MNELLVLGLSHKTAPVAVRERLSVTDAQIERMLGDLAGNRIGCGVTVDADEGDPIRAGNSTEAHS